MDPQDMKQFVAQRSNDPSVAGRLACTLKSDRAEQENADDRHLQVHWEELGDLWRCTISSAGSSHYLARIELHENHAFRVDAREPCSVTISPEDELLCLTRYRPTS